MALPPGPGRSQACGMSTYELHDRTAVVTGAASGMGAATAVLLAASVSRT